MDTLTRSTLTRLKAKIPSPYTSNTLSIIAVGILCFGLTILGGIYVFGILLLLHDQSPAILQEIGEALIVFLWPLSLFGCILCAFRAGQRSHGCWRKEEHQRKQL